MTEPTIEEARLLVEEAIKVSKRDSFSENITAAIKEQLPFDITPEELGKLYSIKTFNPDNSYTLRITNRNDEYSN